MVRAIEIGAAALGHTLRILVLLLMALPQVAALALIVYGVWLFDHRVAIIITGVILLALSAPKSRPTDRRDK
jgi:hypothetical protein